MAKFKKYFILGAICILAITCLFKIISVFQPVKALDTPDFLFYFWTIRMVMAVASLAEFVTILFLVSHKITRFQKLTLIMWLSSAFIVYRAAAFLTGAAEPCPCLGNIHGWVSGIVSHSAINWILRFMVTYLFVGSYICILLDWQDDKNSKSRSRA